MSIDASYLTVIGVAPHLQARQDIQLQRNVKGCCTAWVMRCTMERSSVAVTLLDPQVQYAIPLEASATVN